MNNEQAFSRPGATAQIYGGMTRVATSAAERVDRDFEKSGEMPAVFAAMRQMDVGEAGRKLVAAGCLPPNDPRAVAMQEMPDSDRVARMQSRAGLREEVFDLADELGKRDLGRDGQAALLGIRRSLKSSERSAQLSGHTGYAEAFGRIALSAREAGSDTAASQAGQAFAVCAQAGVVAARTRSMEKSRSGEAR